MANRRCKKLPGIDRKVEPNKSSALQMSYKVREGKVPTAKKQTNAANKAPMGFNPDAPTKFLGGMVGKLAKGLGGAVKGAVMGGDGKFNLKDVGRLALGPAGMAIGAAQGSGLMKLGSKSCPGCVEMCPQCKPGRAATRKYGSPMDKHCF